MRVLINGKIAAFAAAAVVGGMLASGALVWHASQAAFSDPTDNGANNWTAGSVALTDDDSNGVMFNLTALKPGQTGNHCILVQYQGNLAASIKLYGTSVSGTLAPYIDLVVDEGTIGNYSGCGVFASAATPYTGTLANFGANHTNFGNGVGNFAPTGPLNKVYRFTWTLNSSTPDNMQGASASATFTWEAQNT